ncbi:helix-turn-helix transcriptional regulator [Paenibacillus larvae]|nr:helix-turn-helix transcriptional regulator [Paenibacillus larvae]MDT2249066.1 helix-turn-helix transcriptional regulator [Paenibacillus larvae]MDT2255502.1 helix-turn-helix transcriptional regulator [Paenibacillus larvae]MDT2261906.1 helix-turn-helix transcriptional regulator [Paenibacillus larvae]MDT2277208.1 helix-turn-helix transcriptional regulator [Paenibacillus larvae]MDT2287701.1 helix-turn-helix transcriptional regulator [Paenibacillus larvae]
MKIGDRIKNIRKALRYTQKEVAENAGISRMYLSDVEKIAITLLFLLLKRLQKLWVFPWIG